MRNGGWLVGEDQSLWKLNQVGRGTKRAAEFCAEESLMWSGCVLGEADVAKCEGKLAADLTDMWPDDAMKPEGYSLELSAPNLPEPGRFESAWLRPNLFLMNGVLMNGWNSLASQCISA